MKRQLVYYRASSVVCP